MCPQTNVSPMRRSPMVAKGWIYDILGNDNPAPRKQDALYVNCKSLDKCVCMVGECITECIHI